MTPPRPPESTVPPAFRAVMEWAALAAAAIAAYWPAIGGGFIWDDDAHVTKAALRSLHGLWRIWFEVGATQQYYPVLHSAFWVEHRLWGDAPLGYHLLNVLLHATAAFLFVCVLRNLVERLVSRRWFDWPLLAGFIFVLHPVCVESVAWISEQKNTLSAVFYLLAMLAYLKHDGISEPFLQEGRKDREECLRSQPRHLFKKTTGQQLLRDLCDLPVKKNNRTTASSRSPCKKWYFVSFLLFVLAVLSKSVTVTLPAALLVVIWWQRGRLSWKRDVVPLLPFFAIGIAGGLFTAWVERHYIGAHGAAFDLGPVERCLLAGRALGFYAAKVAWPARLIFNYERWHVSASEGWQYLYPAAALAVLIVLWSLRRRSRAPLAAALFFAGTLFPALGFFNVYPFVFSYVADHFQYLAMMGVIALGAGGWSALALSLSKGAGGALSVSGTSRSTLSCLLVCALGILTWRDCHAYRDVETLYRTSLRQNPDAWMPHYNLGIALGRAGRFGEAIREYDRALELNPDDADIHIDLGTALVRLGRVADAIAQFEEAVRLKPDYADAHLNLAAALGQSGQIDRGIAQCEQALRLKDKYPEADYDLAVMLMQASRPAEAIAHYSRVLQLRPDLVQARAGLAQAHYAYGLLLQNQQRPEEAQQQFEEAARLQSP